MKKLIFLLWATAAQATPPDMISLYDRVIGSSTTQLFILRETSDNLGRSIYGLHDVFLVAKNLKTGEDDEIWPVYRVYASDEESRNFPLQNAVNPFEIMAARAAQYTDRDFLPPAATQAPPSEFDDTELWVRKSTLGNAAVMAQISQSIALISAAIQPYPEGRYKAMSFTSPQDLLAGTVYAAQSCRIDSVDTLFRYPQRNIPLARMNCEGSDG